MAVAKDTSSTSSGTGTSLTWSHTVTGSQPVLLVGVSTDAAVDVTGVTYNGVAMTRITSITGGASPTFNFNRSTLYGLINPATGTHDVVVSLASSAAVIGGATSFTSADQSTGWGTAATNRETDGAGGTAVSVTVAGATDEIAFNVASWGINGAGAPAATSGQTQEWQDRTQLNTAAGAGSTASSAASVNLTWTLAAPEFWSSAGVSVIAATGGGAQTWGPLLSGLNNMLVEVG